MSEEEMKILKELSEQSYFGDLPFLLYADLISKLIANYNKEKQKNKQLEQQVKLEIQGRGIAVSAYKEEKQRNTSLTKEINLMKSINIDANYISKDEIRAKIKELDNIESDFAKKVIESPTGLITTTVQVALQELLEE